MKKIDFDTLKNHRKTEECPQFDSIVEQIEITQGNVSEEVLKHIQDCPQCNDYFLFWKKTEGLFQWYATEKGKSEISEWERQISIQKIKQTINRSRRQKKAILWGLLSVTAVALLLVIAMLYFVPSTQAPSVQAIEQPSQKELPSSTYSGSSIPYDTTPEKKTPDKDM
ncbi:MAG TPA: hypothetical protein PLX23_12360 [Candidatus Hydrogenedens sp.]|nr:hypothetical protein [Candidatus Hydrogenedens sp.]